MVSNQPIPPEILAKTSTALGGASLGFGRTQGGLQRKLAYASIGALLSTGAIEGMGEMAGGNEKIASITGNFLDDIPNAAAVTLKTLHRKK
jgi:hypothetical protein